MTITAPASVEEEGGDGDLTIKAARPVTSPLRA